VAVSSTVFTTHFNTLVREGKPVSVALTSGYAWAFWALAAISFAAFVASLTLIRREELAEAPAELTATG
ncbi:MAG TPA: hypothetical protein VIU81_07040, partial [Gaiellaceae bacterium]